MTFATSYPSSIKSLHKGSICDAAICNSVNMISYISKDCISLWSIQNGNLNNLSYVESSPHHHFIKGAFLNSQTLAILTDTHRIYLLTKKTDKFELSDNFIEIKFSDEQIEAEEAHGLEIIHFQKVGKYIFALTNNSNIFYINLALTKIKRRNVPNESKIIKTQSTSDSLFLLFETGRIAQMKQNAFEYLSLPTSSNFCVDKRTHYISVFTNQKQWQLWSLTNLQFIDTIDFAGDSENQESFGIFSPVTSTCAFFTNDSLKFTYFSKITSSIAIPKLFNDSNCNLRFPLFDRYGQTLLFISPDNNDNRTTITIINLATAASCYSDSLSAPLSSTHVFLPTRESLVPIGLPNGHRATLALFGEMALAVSIDSSVLLLPFSDKIAPSVSDGAAHSQLIKNNEILSPNNGIKLKGNQIPDDDNLTLIGIMKKYLNIGMDMKWIDIPIENVKSFAWSSNTLICLSTDGKVHMINVSSLNSKFSNDNIIDTLCKYSNKSNEIDVIVSILRKIKRKLILSNEKSSNFDSDENQIYSLVNSLLSLAKKAAVDDLMSKLPDPFIIKGKPLSISASGNGFLATFPTQLSFYQIEPPKLMSTTSVGQTSIRNAVYLSSETIAVLTSDFHLLLIYHTKVLHRTFDDVLAIQLTGSNGWPLFIIGGEKWRLLGANYSELELDFDPTITNQRTSNERSPKRNVNINNSKTKDLSLINHQEYGYSLMIGVDGFSIVCLDPFALIDFVHLVVCQSLIANDDENSNLGLDSPKRKANGENIRINSSSLASAVSILSQLTEERRLNILQKVGVKIKSKSSFDRFLSLINRYIEIEDQVLAYVIANNKRFNFIESPSSANSKKVINIDYVSFFKQSFSRGWFLTAAELIKCPQITKSDCHQLLIKSDFNITVVKRFIEKFNSFDDIIEIEDDIINFYRMQFLQNRFSHVANLLPYFEIPMKKFMLKSRRERECNMQDQFSIAIDSLKTCTKQQLIDLSSVFEEVNAYDLVFCCCYCLNHYSKCIECIEKQQRIMRSIDSEILITVGYTK